MSSRVSLGHVMPIKPIAREIRPKAAPSRDQQWPSLLQCAIVATALKILLFPAYKSTDFEVHRNWLAITHSLPPSKWYFESTSEWTLDYPPFFAWFEWLLSQIAVFVDEGMVKVANLKHDSWATVAFQRSSVIITELILVYSLHVYAETTTTSSSAKRRAHTIALSILLSPGFLIIDHIHFQYNGAMYGLLILSLTYARQETTLLTSGILFAILLCFKHIYLYLAPAYFIYLLRVYCLSPQSIFRPQFTNAIKLGVSMVVVFSIAFGPFAIWGQLDQLKSRLFPFSRGLCHAYWAPNAWAIYSFTDRVLIYLAPHLNLQVDKSAVASLTRGLVGDTQFAVLPDIDAQLCFGITLAFQIVALTKLWLRPTWDVFVGAVTLCGYASFLFGWHVHEKAVLLIIVPFSLIALKDRSYLASFTPLIVAGHVSLFPLLFGHAEFPLKTGYTLVWLICFSYAFDRLAPAPQVRPRVFLLDRFSVLYVAVSVPLLVYCSLVHGLVFGSAAYEFVPLMFISTYCAVGVIASWVGFTVCYWSS